MQTAWVNRARHKKGCSFGAIFCPNCSNSSKRSQSHLNFQIAKKHNLCQTKSSQLATLLSSVQRLQSFAIAHIEIAQRTKRIGNQKWGYVTVSGRNWRLQIKGRTRNVQAPFYWLWDEEWQPEILQFCHGDAGCTHFEQKARHSLRKAQLSSKVECWVQHVLKNVDRTCGFDYAHGNNTLMQRSKLVASE